MFTKLFFFEIFGDKIRSSSDINKKSFRLQHFLGKIWTYSTANDAPERFLSRKSSWSGKILVNFGYNY